MTKPATLVTSVTLIEIARMPGVMVGGGPAPAPFAASFSSVIGSFRATLVMTPRSRTASMLSKPPSSGVPAGHGTSFTDSRVSSLPSGSCTAATTACFVAISTRRSGMLLIARYTPKLAAAAAPMATTRTMKVRVLRFIRSPEVTELASCRGHFRAHRRPAPHGNVPDRAAEITRDPGNERHRVVVLDEHLDQRNAGTGVELHRRSGARIEVGHVGHVKTGGFEVLLDPRRDVVVPIARKDGDSRPFP